MALINQQEAVQGVKELFSLGDCYCDEYSIVGMLNSLPTKEIIHCKDCKHFEYDHPYIIQGIPVLGHEVCNAWGDGCKTDENGYCFMAERRTDEQTD